MYKTFFLAKLKMTLFLHCRDFRDFLFSKINPFFQLSSVFMNLNSKKSQVIRGQ